MERLILVCVVLLAVGLAAALARERRLRMASQLLLRRLMNMRRTKDGENPSCSRVTDALESDRLS